MYNDCRDCAHYYGDCGNHFIDADEHINYDIPDECCMDNSLDDHGSCFCPSEQYIKEQKTNIAKNLVANYSAEDLQMALNQLQKDKQNV